MIESLRFQPESNNHEKQAAGATWADNLGHRLQFQAKKKSDTFFSGLNSIGT